MGHCGDSRVWGLSFGCRLLSSNKLAGDMAALAAETVAQQALARQHTMCSVRTNKQAYDFGTGLLRSSGWWHYIMLLRLTL